MEFVILLIALELGVISAILIAGLLVVGYSILTAPPQIPFLLAPLSEEKKPNATPPAPQGMYV